MGRVVFNFSRLSRSCLFSAAIGVAAMTTVSACGSSPATTPDSSGTQLAISDTCITNEAAPLALVIGARSNVPKPSLPTTIVNPLLQAAGNAGQQISLIEIDGQPQVSDPPPFTTAAQNAAARTQALDNYLNGYFLSPIYSGKVHAQTGEANVLDALDKAGQAVGPGGNIIVIDSGLQTVAPLQYQTPGLLMSPASDVVSFLKQQNLLPDLSGRHVLLSGFGYTASPQPALNEAQRNNLISQWTAIVKASGACVTVSSLPNTAAELPGLPAVSVVTPPPPPSFSKISNNCGTVVLQDAGSVGFQQGSASFRDPAAALATLSSLADTLKKGSEHITLIGSTSSEGGDAVNDPLSLRRANAVKAALVSLHVPASRISTVGEGSHWSGRMKDLGSGGVLLPGPAEQDREVVVQLPQCQG